MFPFGIPTGWLNAFRPSADLSDFNTDPDADIARTPTQTYSTVTHGMTLAELLGEESCPPRE
jgi:hypothetical protein